MCALRHGRLLRSFSADRELLRGGLAFRLDVLSLAEARGCREIVATERRSGIEYRIALDAFRAKGWPYNSSAFGRQWACDLRHWAADGPEHAPGEPCQLALAL